MWPRRGCLAILLALASGVVAGSGDERPEADAERFLAGRYLAVGRLPDSATTYSATVTLEPGKTGLIYTRRVNGRLLVGSARVETNTADHNPVLRVRFVDQGIAYEGTYLWRSDLDNYARISGYLYRLDQKTRDPGLEALFIAQN